MLLMRQLNLNIIKAIRDKNYCDYLLKKYSVALV